MRSGEFAKSKILSFKDLESGCGEGERFNDDVIKKALILYEASQEAGFDITDAFPGPSSD